MSAPARDSGNPIGRSRATALLAALAVVNLGYAAALIWLAYISRNPQVLESTGLPIPDFTAFWAAGRMALEGVPALAYDWQAHRAVEVAGLGHDFSGWMPWHYPPPFQLALTPLALLPHWGAMALWNALTLGLFLWTCWRILPDRLTLLAALAAAPTAMILINGQTGFLVAGVLGLALLEIDRRPLRAGLLLGLIGFKPHLVAAVPVPLVFAGRWKAVLGGAGMTVALAALSWLVLGGDTWRAFIASITETSGVFAGVAGRWTMYASPYGALRFTGLGFQSALAVQAVLALAVLVLTVRAWRHPATPADLRAALICFAAVVATPRVLSYDLHILVIGALFQMRHALRAGFYPGEQLLLAAVALAAFLSMLAAPGANAALGAILFAGCWWGHVRRSAPERSTA